MGLLDRFTGSREELPAEEVEARAVSEEAPEEPESEPAPKKAKRWYMYGACDRKGRLLRTERGELYVLSVQGEEMPKNQEWPVEIRSRAQSSKRYRVEIEFPEGQTKPTKEDKGRARVKLERLAEEWQNGEPAEASGPAPEETETVETEAAVSPESREAAETGGSEPESSPVEEAEASRQEAPEEKTAVPELPAETDGEPETCPESEKKPVPSEGSGSGSEAARDRLKQERIELAQDHITMMDMIEDEGEKTRRSARDDSRELQSFLEMKTRGLEVHARERSDGVVQKVEAAVRRGTEGVTGHINGMAESLDEKQDRLLSKAGAMSRQISDLGESVESMEGKLGRLDQLDKIAKLLQNKGMTVTMDIPPLSAEEEDVVNLVRYSQKITEQLGYAARELLRKQADFARREQNSANEQQAQERKLADARAEGIREGRLETVKRLLFKYEDVEAFRETENGHVLWVFLEELGAEIDGGGLFEKGREVRFSAEEAERMLGLYSGVDGEGRYQVVRTGLVLEGEIVLKAEFRRLPEDPGESGTAE